MKFTSLSRGFTLIEIIAVLVILSILFVGIFPILSNAVKGFNQAKNVTDYTETVQSALTRISHEMANINTKKALSISNNSIIYYFGTDSSPSTVSLSGSNLTLNDYTILSNVSSFIITKPSDPRVDITITSTIPDVDGAISRSFTIKTDLNPERFQ